MILIKKQKRKRRRIAKDVVNKESVTEKNKNFKLNKGKIPPSAPSDDEVQKQIKETLEKLQSSSKSKHQNTEKKKEILIKKGLKKILRN